MECKDCKYSIYDDFCNDYLCNKNDVKELRFYKDADAPVCEYKLNFRNSNFTFKTQKMNKKCNLSDLYCRN